MHYADFAEDDVSSANNLYRSDTDSGNQSAALMAAIKEYEASKWKVIGQKVGKPAKVDYSGHPASPSYKLTIPGVRAVCEGAFRRQGLIRSSRL